jgi:hypothetical protein
MSKYGNRKPNYKPNDDYYTPRWIFENLKLTFDVDVCAPVGGVPWIPANKSYSIDDNGLEQDWNGLIWCNPPFSNPSPWIEKFIQHNNGVMLTQVSKSKAFLDLWNKAKGIVFFNHSLMKFEHKTEGTKTIFMPVALFAMGEVAVNAIQKIGKVR